MIKTLSWIRSVVSVTNGFWVKALSSYFAGNSKIYPSLSKFNATSEDCTTSFNKVPRTRMLHFAGVSAQISVPAFSNPLQMMTAARSGLPESALSSVVLAFQAPRVRGSLLTFYADAQTFRLRWWYGLCVFLATVVRCGASVALNALTSIISASLIRHLHM